MLFVFRAGAIEGQSGTAMSNKDFERLLGAFRDNNPLIYKEKIKKYVIDSAKNINTQVDLYEDTKNTGAFDPFNAVPPQILNALDKEFAFERVEVPEFATTSTLRSSGIETFITNRFNSSSEDQKKQFLDPKNRNSVIKALNNQINNPTRKQEFENMGIFSPITIEQLNSIIENIEKL